jgi:hypothetical protein
MDWYDFPPEDGVPGGILEFSSELTPPGFALELHVFTWPEGTVAVWLLEDGRSLGQVAAAIS